jgi:pyridoxamine 5'-phosphate oxidase
MTIKDYNFVFKKFDTWLAFAKQYYSKHNIDNYNTFSLGTSSNNICSSRMVLLKSFDEKGFVFFTNYNSQKAHDISLNNNVSMLFHFNPFARQIRVIGNAEKISNEESDIYYHSRPYLSKIGAWASNQSSTMDNYYDLVKNVAKYGAIYPNNPPRPEHWGGYIIKPTKIEFWQEKQFRLHIRKSYLLTDNQWQESILYP